MSPTRTTDPAIEIHTHSACGESLTPVLHAFLPHSLPLLRRIQFRHRSPHRTLLASFPPSTPPFPADWRPTPEPQVQTDHVGKEAESPHPFVVAFVDQSRVLETECWIFSSFELSAVGTAEGHGRMKLRDGDEQKQVNHYANVQDGTLTHEGKIKNGEEGEPVNVTKAYLSALFDAISTLPCPARLKGEERRILRVGAVHSSLVPLLASAGWLEWCSEPWQKWIFPSLPATLPSSSSREHVTSPVPENPELPAGFEFGPVPPEALELVRQRSEIRRTVSTLAKLPGVAVFMKPTASGDSSDMKAAGTRHIVAWGFLGVDGSINALHVESPWRGLGLAKGVMRRLLRRWEYGTWFEGDEDGYAGHADVHRDNRASLAVCARSGAQYRWDVHWVRVDLGVMEEGTEGSGGGQ